MCAYLDIRTFSDFEELVSSHGGNWNDSINLYKGYDWSDYGKMVFENNCYKIPEVLENFIDFEGYGRYIGDYYAEEYEEGIIEIYA